MIPLLQNRGIFTCKEIQTIYSLATQNLRRSKQRKGMFFVLYKLKLHKREKPDNA